jgi:hypothetical protein
MRDVGTKFDGNTNRHHEIGNRDRIELYIPKYHETL